MILFAYFSVQRYEFFLNLQLTDDFFNDFFVV